MRTPRTVDEIADAILPASIDGIHERALCLLLAEHERDIAELREQLPKLPPGEWTRESVAAFNTARCESGEDAQASEVSGQAIPCMSNDAVKSADDGLRAPGSTAPAPMTVEMESDFRWLENDIGVKTEFKDYGGARKLAQLIPRLRALAAARDRLAQQVKSLSVMLSCENREGGSVCATAETDDPPGKLLHRCYACQLERARYERDALQRRIEAMAAREPTDDQLDTIYQLLGHPNAPQQRWREVWRYVRDVLLATPASDGPKSSPPVGGHLHGFNEDGTMKPCGYDCELNDPAPQPSPATPSAEDVEWWRQWFLAQDEIPLDYAQGLAERLSADVSKREAGLREELATARAQLAAAKKALEHLRPALQTANEDNLRLLKLLDDAKRRSVS